MSVVRHSVTALLPASPALLAIVLAGCTVGTGGSTFGPGVTGLAASTETNSVAPDGKGHAITFEVLEQGVRKASSISYSVGGNMSQANNSPLPWRKDSTVTDACTGSE
jgi:hypothetical protein